MSNINTWLEQFKTNWVNKDIENIISLFTQDVEYWETPYKRFNNLEEIKKEWENIYNQENIDFNYEIFSKENDKYTVQWSLNYTDKDSKKKEYRGIFLIKLNKENKCFYFLQYFNTK
jgi:ketosteroid isomerase-like protein